jgi:hypothetical protein
MSYPLSNGAIQRPISAGVGALVKRGIPTYTHARIAAGVQRDAVTSLNCRRSM